MQTSPGWVAQTRGMVRAGLMPVAVGACMAAAAWTGVGCQPSVEIGIRIRTFGDSIIAQASREISVVAAARGHVFTSNALDGARLDFPWPERVEALRADGDRIDRECLLISLGTNVDPLEYPQNELFDLADLEDATRRRALWLLPSRSLHPHAVALIEQAIPAQRILDLRFSSQDGTHADTTSDGRLSLALQLVRACEEHLAIE